MAWTSQEAVLGGQTRSSSQAVVPCHWSAEEDQILRDAYPDYGLAQRRLPNRSLAALKKRACALDIVKRRHVWTMLEVKRIVRLVAGGASDVELAKAFPHLRPSQVRAKVGSLKLPKRPPRLVSFDEPVLVAVRRRAVEQGLSLRALDRSARTGSYFQNSTRQLRLVHVARATAILGGEVVIRWDD